MATARKERTACHMWLCVFGIEKMRSFYLVPFSFARRGEMGEGGHRLFEKNGGVSNCPYRKEESGWKGARKCYQKRTPCGWDCDR